MGISNLGVIFSGEELAILSTSLTQAESHRETRSDTLKIPKIVKNFCPSHQRFNSAVQLTTTLMGAGVVSSVCVMIKKRCPSPLTT